MPDLSESSEDYPEIEAHKADEIFQVAWHPGDTFFAFLCVCLGIGLLSQIETQTKWISNVDLWVQPRFLPSLSLLGFLFFAVGYLIISYRQHLKNSGDVLLPSMELFHWCRPLEYAFYFMLYVYLTPRLGYLPTTLLIYTALTLRAGYRNLRYIILALAVGFTTVFTFKTLLQVRIPGGQMYELFPEHIRNFMILYF